jgi:tetratricopeptide (TPR) repeat protein
MGKSSRIEKETSAAACSLQGVTAHVDRSPRFKYFVAGFVSLLTFLVYLSSLHNEFVMWDDNVYVYENPYLHPLNVAFFKWAFSAFYATNWHPLTWVSHALDYAVWGLNPLGHHLTNNILHAVNTFIVVILVTKLLEAWRNSSHQNPALHPYREQSYIVIAAVTGLLFGLHPLHVESVAWVSERKDLLCAMFFLLSTLAYTKYVSDGGGLRNKHYILVLFLFALALLSKPMAVSLPVVLLILDWHPFNRIGSMKSFLSAFLEKLPLIALSLVSSVLTMLAQKGAVKSFEVIPLSSRVIVAAESLLSYLWKMVLPINLIPYYQYPKSISLFSAEPLLSIILVSGITAACIVMVKKQKLWLAVWGYYVLTMFPVIGIIQVGGQAMADRYTYLPSIGPFILIGLLATWMWEKSLLRRGAWSGCVIVGGILIMASLSYLTLRQVAVWKDSSTLWTYVIEREPEDVPLAHNNLGYYYTQKKLYDKAINEILTAIRLQPDDTGAHLNLGVIYQAQNMYDQAIEEYLTVIRLNPDLAEAHNNLGVSYKAFKMFDKAIEQYLLAIHLNPDYADAHNNLGVIYLTLNMPDKAMNELRTGVNLMPTDAKAHFYLGDAYLSLNMPNKAMEQYLIAVNLRPDYVDAHNNLAGIYQAFNMPDKAVGELQIVIKLKPDYAEAHFNLGSLYYRMGQVENSRREFITGLEIKPDDQQAQQFLKAILSH